MHTLQKDDCLTTPYELYTGLKPKIKRFCVLFCPCVIKKYTTVIFDKNNKRLNINVSNHLTQHSIQAIFIGFDQHTLGYLVYIPSTSQIVNLIDIVFDEYVLSALIYKNRAYCEALLTMPFLDIVEHQDDVTDHTGDIISSSFLPSLTSNLIEEEVIEIKKSN